MDYRHKLIENIGEKRYEHSLRVMETAGKLAEIYGADRSKVKTAAILHDCAKYSSKIGLLKKIDDFDIILDNIWKNNLGILHGPIGAKVAEEEYGVSDVEILDAIYYHSTGRINMSILDKIIYIADYIEPKRNYPRIETIRAMAFEDLNMSILMAMNDTILYLVENNRLIHPNTLEARNQLILEIYN